MKTKFIKTAMLMLCILSFSCSDDFLNKTDPTSLVASTFYKTETQLEQAVNGVYGQLQPLISDQWQYNEFITDNTTLDFNLGDRGQGPSLEALEFWQVNSSTTNISNLYNSIYQSLVNINTTLAKMEETDVDATKKQRFEGELKFIRAYYYFLLVQYFGDVVIVTEPISAPAEAYIPLREPAAKVYELVKSDLATAVANLPVSYDANNKGRATKGAALSLLGKVYLTLHDYPNAISTLQQVLPLGYELLTNYGDIFDTNNKNNTESVFEIQFQGDNTLGEGSGFIYTFAPRESAGAVINFPGQNGGGWNLPTLDIIAAYEPGDLRKDVSLKEGYTNLEGEYIAVPFINKFNHEHTIRGVTNDNWPVIRYADVLLMLAESINEQTGPTADALGYLNQIRTRADLPELSGLDQTTFRTAVLKERRIELAFENHRWFDLKRTKTPEELAAFMNAYGAFEKSNPTTSRGGIPFSQGDFDFKSYEAFFPIPADQRRINTELSQNDGYN